MPVFRKVEAVVSQNAAASAASAHRTPRRAYDFEMEHSVTMAAQDEDGYKHGHERADGQQQQQQRQIQQASLLTTGRRKDGRLAGVARHTLGLILLLCVVLLWTTCNFLGSVCLLLRPVPLHCFLLYSTMWTMR